MNDKIKAFLFAAVIGVVFGITMYLVSISKSTPTKTYPIEVRTGYGQAGSGFECDSMKGDTFYKDGNSIVCKNILNIKFK